MTVNIKQTKGMTGRNQRYLTLEFLYKFMYRKTPSWLEVAALEEKLFCRKRAK